MNYNDLLPYIEDYGYLALYFALWLGFFGLPIPNEVIVMTSALVSKLSILDPFLSFWVTYAGVISSLTTLYFLGYFFHQVIQKRIRKKEKLQIRIETARKLVERYGLKSLFLAYFLPGARHFVPFILGVNKIRFVRFCAAAYSVAFVWTLIFFSSGLFFSNHIKEIGSHVYIIGFLILIVILFVIIIMIIGKKIKNSFKKRTHKKS